MTGPRLLTLDIETSPSIVETWSLFKPFIGLNQVRAPGQVICFAAKYHDEKRVRFHSVHHDGWSKMMAAAQRLLSDADGVITYNGDAFDLKHLRRELILAGLNPPAPYKSIDLYKVVKQNFKFLSHKLDHVAQELGVGAKAHTGGYDTWRGCMAGDEKAWNTMRRYNKQDVVVTEALFDKLRPWMKNFPNMGLWLDSDAPLCPRCGSTSLQRRGTAIALTYKYARYQCQDCGSWSRGAKSESVASGDTRSIS